ncbi:MAG: Holliday junction resolvase RuvX [Planctomycetes bacterium]|nr:Holliday junction resolvase RuvX [Planctomycetota bacterium]
MSPAAAVIAVDHGTKKTGFASTDALRTAQWPLEAWHGPGDSEELLDHISSLVEERSAATLLVGLPLNMDSTEGGQARAVRVFIERAQARLKGVEVIAWDERLTTREAEVLLREAGFRGEDMKARRDSWSALVLLRDWLESGEPR